MISTVQYMMSPCRFMIISQRKNPNIFHTIVNLARSRFLRKCQSRNLRLACRRSSKIKNKKQGICLHTGMISGGYVQYIITTVILNSTQPTSVRSRYALTHKVVGHADRGRPYCVIQYRRDKIGKKILFDIHNKDRTLLYAEECPILVRTEMGHKTGLCPILMRTESPNFGRRSDPFWVYKWPVGSEVRYHLRTLLVWC